MFINFVYIVQKTMILFKNNINKKIIFWQMGCQKNRVITI